MPGESFGRGGCHGCQRLGKVIARVAADGCLASPAATISAPSRLSWPHLESSLLACLVVPGAPLLVVSDSTPRSQRAPAIRSISHPCPACAPYTPQTCMVRAYRGSCSSGEEQEEGEEEAGGMHGLTSAGAASSQPLWVAFPSFAAALQRARCAAATAASTATPRRTPSGSRSSTPAHAGSHPAGARAQPAARGLAGGDAGAGCRASLRSSCTFVGSAEDAGGQGDGGGSQGGAPPLPAPSLPAPSSVGVQ